MAGFAEISVEFLPTEQGGRRTPICLSTDNTSHYRPHLRVRDGDEAYFWELSLSMDQTILFCRAIQLMPQFASPTSRTFVTMHWL